LISARKRQKTRTRILLSLKTLDFFQVHIQCTFVLDSNGTRKYEKSLGRDIISAFNCLYK